MLDCLIDFHGGHLCLDSWSLLIDLGLLDWMVDAVGINSEDDVGILDRILGSFVFKSGPEESFLEAFAWDNDAPRILHSLYVYRVEQARDDALTYLRVLLRPQAGRTPAELVRMWDRNGVSLIHLCFFLIGASYWMLHFDCFAPDVISLQNL